MIDDRKEIVFKTFKTDITRDEDKVKNNAIDDILYSMDLTPEVVCKKTKSKMLTMLKMLTSKRIPSG